MINKSAILALTTLLTSTSCKEVGTTNTTQLENQEVDSKREEIAILKTLNNETKNAFQRDYESWKENWVHDTKITKIYINYTDSTFSEAVGWDEISQFVKKFIEEHPDPEPVPKLLNKIDVRLYENGAWVTYEQQDSLRGLKREARLMEKVNGEWKIAGMQTTIYGFKNSVK